MTSGRRTVVTLGELTRRFPKRRPALPPEYEKIFVEAYRNNRQGNGVASGIAIYLEQWMHRQVVEADRSYPLLELGAGTLNHVPFEDRTGVYDVVEPMAALYQNSPYVQRIRCIYGDVAEVPAETRYRRIASIAVLEHILDLPRVTANCALLLADDGTFLAGIPSEGSALWYAAWRYGTGMAFLLRYHLSYATLMRYEHVNKAYEIQQVISTFFEDIKIKRFPLPVFNLSLYTFVEARYPRKQLAREFLTVAHCPTKADHSA